MKKAIILTACVVLLSSGLANAKALEVYGRTDCPAGWTKIAEGKRWVVATVCNSYTTPSCGGNGYQYGPNVMTILSACSATQPGPNMGPYNYSSPVFDTGRITTCAVCVPTVTK